MAVKKIFIEYDVDASDLKIAGQETLSLTQQLRILKKELQKGDLKPEQFDILRKKIGETEDRITKTTVKSKDFFGVLSTLPGPVGAFGSSLLSVVDTLKVFSSFTFKDIKNSLSDVADDVVEITSNFTGLDKAVKDVGAGNTELISSNKQLADSSNQSALAAGATAGAIQNQTAQIRIANREVKNQTSNTGELITKQENFREAAKGSQLALFGVTDAEKKAFIQKRKLTIATNEQAVSSETATVATTTQTVATNTLTLAQRAATFATTALKIALASLGIGLIIIGITELLSVLGDFISGTKQAERAQKLFNDELERTNDLLDLDLKASKRRQDLRVAELKARGASEKELNDLTLSGLKENLKLRQDALEDANILYNKTLKREDEKSVADLEIIGKRKLELEQQVQDGINELKIAELQDDIKATEERKARNRDANDKLLADQKEYEQRRQADTKSAEEQIRQLVDENRLLSISDERTRQLQELENQRKNENDKINELLISEELKNNLQRQTRIKFELKNKQLTDKFNQEDLELKLDFNRKIEDIEIAAIENTRQREEVERQVKLRRDLEDLEQDKQFILLSETDKEKVRQNIRLIFANQTNELLKQKEKEGFDDRLKLLDDELRFLQIRQEAIRVGTRAFFDGQRDILEASQRREIELAEGKEKEITAIKEKYVKLRKDLDQQENLATLQAIGETIQAFGTLTGAIASSYDEEAKTSKDAFEKRKKLQVATAVMSAAGGIIQILAQPSTLPSPFDFIVKGINATALGVATAVQIANIKKTQFEGSGGGSGGNNLGRGFANGGLVTGPGTSKSDSIPARLSNGEAVMTAGAVTMFSPMLSMMNQMGGGTSFTDSVSATLPDNPSVSNPSQEPMIMKTYVVESELTSIQQRQARLKDLSTL